MTPDCRPPLRGLLLAGFVAWSAFADDMQTPGYRLSDLSMAPAGGPSASQSHVGNEAIGQPVAGALITPRFTLQLGAPPFMGPGMSLITLFARHNGANPAAVDLSWTGLDAPFVVYRSTDCRTLLAPSNAIAVVPGSAFSDAAPPAGALVCYNVRGTPQP